MMIKQELSNEEVEQVNGGAYVPNPKPRKQDYIPLILGFHCSNCGTEFSAAFNGDALAISGLPAAGFCPNCHSLVYR